MKRKGIILILVFFIFSPLTARGLNKGAATMVLQGGKLGNAPFSHHLHQNAVGDCTICHTLFPQVAGSIDKLKAEGNLKKREAMNQCVECHKKEATTVGKALPTKFSECHKK